MDIFAKLTEITSLKKHKRLARTLQYIWRAGSANRIELACELDVSKVSISHYVDELLDSEIIVEEGGIPPERSGRRPITIQMNDKLFYSLGISLLNNEAKINLLNARNEIIAEKSLSADKLPVGAGEKCDYIITVIDKLLNENKISENKLIGIGIAVTGITDPEEGMIINSGQFPEDINFAICDVFAKKYKRPCTLINTSHLSAYNEKRWGNAAEKSTFLYLDSAFGLGMVLDGRLFRGHQFHGGEAGLMQVEAGGAKGADGREGLLGTLAPFYKITDTIEGIIEKNGLESVPEYFRSSKGTVTLAMVVKGIEKGDQLCGKLMAECFNVISRAVINLAYLFNPEVIYLPPWTSRCPEVSIDIIKRMMGHYGIHNWKLKTEIESASLGEESLARGAGAIITGKVLENDILF